MKNPKKSHALIMGWAAGSAAFMLTFWIHAANAAVTNPWLGSEPLTLTSSATLPAGQHQAYSNQDCYSLKYKTSYFSSETKCVVDTVFGAMSLSPTGSSSTIVFNNSAYGGTTQNHTAGFSYSSSLSAPRPIQNSHLLRYSYNASGHNYTMFFNGVPSKINSSKSISGIRTYSFTDHPNVRLEDVAGNPLPTNLGTISSSPNGAWLVADSPLRAFTRVNLATFEVLPFADTFSTSITPYPDNIQTAVTNDGRYVAISGDGNYFRIYDLSTCTGTVPATINAPISCQYRDLWPALTAQLGPVTKVSSLRFINNDTLSFYATYNFDVSTSPATFTASKFNLATASGTAAASIQYLGMGDSFSSGEGASSYINSTDTPGNRCHLSSKSYPQLLGGLFGSNNFNSVACSGAKLEDIFNENDKYRGQPGQVTDLVDRDIRNNVPIILNSFLPGYISQTEFVGKYKPNVITLTGGGNDVDFSGIVKRCTTIPDICYDTYEDRAELVLSINRLYPRLVNTYQQIKTANPTARVYVISYPELAKNDGSCALNVRLSNEEVKFSNLLVNYLNSVIEKAAGRAGVGFVDVSQAFYGHRLCESKNSSVAANGLTAGNDILRIVGNESFHPNALGHELLSNVIRRDTQNLTTGMPPENTAVTEPPMQVDELEGLEILASLPTEGRQISRVVSDHNMVSSFVVRGASAAINLKGLVFGLLPNSLFKAILHSEPVELSSFSSDSDGDIDISLLIPADTEPGYHSLRVTGTGIDSELVEIHKTVYIAANISDYDGDGIPNAADICPDTQPDGIDEDQDGIDDSCDNLVESIILPVAPAITVAATVQPATTVTAKTTTPENEAESKEEASVLDKIRAANQNNHEAQVAAATTSSGKVNYLKPLVYAAGTILIATIVTALLKLITILL